MANPGDFAYTLKQQADILRIVGDYVKLKKAGAQNYSGLCPFHNEKTPSFSVHATRQFFHCFGCGASGDVFSFIQKIENITFPEAVRAIAQRLNVALPKITYDNPSDARQAELRTALLEIQERACAFFQEYLRRPEGAHARQYLAGRGLNEEMIQAFRIGYAPDSGFLLRDRLKGEFPEEVLRESGVFSWKDGLQPSALPPQEQQIAGLGRNDDVKAGALAQDDKQDRGAGSGAAVNGQRPTTAAMYSKFRNRVIFPITNESGKIIAFTGRTLSTDEKAGPKYLNSPETAIYSKSKVLFNLDHARQAIRELDYAILVEGQMDSISLYAAGFHNVIASSGTAFTELQAKLLGRFSRNVVVNFDPDTAGAKATERTLSLLVEEEFQIKVLTLEPGLDPDLFIRRKGKDAYSEALRNSQLYFDYLIERARAQFPVRSAEGKVKAVNYLLPHVQRVPSRIVRDELAREIAQKLGIDSAVLRQELKHAATSRSSVAIKAPAEAQVTEAEKILIRALASPTEIQSSAEPFSRRDGAEQDFDPAHQAHLVLSGTQLYRGLATEQLIDALLGASPEANVMDVPMPEADRNLLAAILIKEEEELTPERVESAVRALERIQIRRKLDGIQRELQSGRLDSVRLQVLLEEKVRLKRALMDPVLASQETSEQSA
jgi:DNA primase